MIEHGSKTVGPNEVCHNGEDWQMIAVSSLSLRNRPS